VFDIVAVTVLLDRSMLTSACGRWLAGRRGRVPASWTGATWEPSAGVVAGEVAHALLGLRGNPVVPQPAVARAVVTGPAVVEVAGVLRVYLRRVHVEGQQVAEVAARLVGLLEDGKLSG